MFEKAVWLLAMVFSGIFLWNYFGTPPELFVLSAESMAISGWFSQLTLGLGALSIILILWKAASKSKSNSH